MATALDQLTASDDHTVLIKLMNRSDVFSRGETDFLGRLAGADAGTVLAPTNDAFAALAAAVGYVPLNDNDLATFVFELFAMVSDGSALPMVSAFLDGLFVSTAETTASLAAAGQVTVDSGDTLTVTGTTLEDAEDDLPDAAMADGPAADNGSIITLDAVPMPFDLPISSANPDDSFFVAAQNAQTAYLGDGVDYYNANGGSDFVHAGGGDDVILGGCGEDELYGASGDDFIKGGAGKDDIYGGDGADTLRGDASNDRIFGGDHEDWLDGGSGNDKLYGGHHDDFLNGGGGKDMVHGGAGDDTLKGDGGDDHLYGGSGNDVLMGERGCDHLFGGDGDDRLVGAVMMDEMTGGAGADTFVFLHGNDSDEILDFEDGTDLIDVASWGFADFAAFQVATTWTVTATGTTIDFGDGDTLIVAGTPTLTDADFILS